MLKLKSMQLVMALRIFLTLLFVIQPLTPFGEVAYSRTWTGAFHTGKSSNADPIAEIDAIVVNGSSQSEARPEDIEVIQASGTTATLVRTADKLFTGDVVKTKEGDQVTLRFLNMNNGQENLIFLDQKTEVEIGSLCLRSGWLLAQVGLNFKICVGNTTLGVERTEFEVSSTPEEPLKVSVFKGEVEKVDKLENQPETQRAVITTPTAFATPAVKVEKITEKTELIVSKEPGKVDLKVDLKPLPETVGQMKIDYWSDKIITAYQARQIAKPNKNYPDDLKRSQEFKKARFNALWKGEAKSFQTIGEVYNDWGKGQKAKDMLEVAGRDPAVKNTLEYEANLGEAYRLSGNAQQAEFHFKKALDVKPDYAFANAGQGQVLSDLYEKSVEKDLKVLEDARMAVLRSLLAQSSGPPVDKQQSEKVLDEVLKLSGSAFIASNPKWVERERFWCEKSQPEGIVYKGVLDLPTERNLGFKISGPAELYIVGNQFKLKTGSRILTGSIVGTTSGNYTAVNLQFDDPRISGALSQPIGLSFQQLGNCNRLDFKSTFGQEFAAVKMTAEVSTPM